MIAVDTNVLVYAVDANEPEKGQRATALLKEIESQSPVLLWQVVCEFGAAMVRRRSRSEIKVGIPEMLEAWLGIYPLAMPSKQVVHTGWRLMGAHQMSYWDAMLLAACVEAGVTRLYTEDMQGKPVVEGVELVNPFK